MNYLKVFVFLFTITAFSFAINAQFTSASGGLAFSSGVEFNTGNTGNPGFFVKGNLKLTKRLYIVPAVTVFSKFEKGDFNKTLKTHMFQGDVDVQYGIYKDKYIKVLGFGGLNATALSSKWDIHFNEGLDLYNKSDLKPGLNLGGALQLYVNDGFDAYISAKYIVSTFDQVLIQVGTIYNFGGKNRKGSW